MDIKNKTKKQGKIEDMKLFQIIYQSLLPNNTVSNMRLATTFIVLTGCLSMLTLAIVFAVSAFSGKAGISDIIAFGTVVTSFTGIGIWGKVAQKKTESQTNVEPINPQSNG